MIIPVNKPAGMTSQDVVSRIKYMFRASGRNVKVGHSGTLDPICTGVLPILTDSYTKLSDFLPSDKAYRAKLLLGRETDTEDITGTVISEKEVNVGVDAVKAAAAELTGEILQTPPMYSALKIDGMRLYDLAREGKTVERKPRKVTVYSFDVTPTDDPCTYILDISCSSGTYIRTLCADLGNKLGTGGCMAALERTMSNSFVISDCVTLEELEPAIAEKREDEYSFYCETVFNGLPKLTIADSAVKYYLNGGVIDKKRIFGSRPETGATALVYDFWKNLLGIGRMTEEGLKSEWHGN